MKLKRLLPVVAAAGFLGVCPRLITSEPFEVGTVLRIGSLCSNGDLYWTRTLEESGRLPFAVKIRHSCEPCDYRRPRSRFDLIPFTTCIRYQDSRLIWETPGGRKIELIVDSSVCSASATSATAIAERFGCFLSGELVSWASVDSEVRCIGNMTIAVIFVRNWVLAYASGSLVGFLDTHGKVFDVVSDQGRICDVAEDGTSLAHVIWNSGRLPSKLILGDMQIDFLYSDERLLTRLVSNKGACDISFKYNEGMIAIISSERHQIERFAWKEQNGADALNLALSSRFIRFADGTEYDYALQNDRVILTQFGLETITTLTVPFNADGVRN